VEGIVFFDSHCTTDGQTNEEENTLSIHNSVVWSNVTSKFMKYSWNMDTPLCN